MFDSEADKWLVKQTKEYFLEFKKEPTLEALKISIEDIQDFSNI